jgi:hypothetical protein
MVVRTIIYMKQMSVAWGGSRGSLFECSMYMNLYVTHASHTQKNPLILRAGYAPDIANNARNKLELG